MLSSPDNNKKDRLSTRILKKEEEGYILNSNAEIEYVVNWQNQDAKISYLQVLSNITMNRC